MDLQTQLVHNKWRIDAQTGAVSVPIHHASTFHQFDFDTFGKYDYSRSGNPTREALEETIAEPEGASAVLRSHRAWLPFQQHFYCCQKEITY